MKEILIRDLEEGVSPYHVSTDGGTTYAFMTVHELLDYICRQLGTTLKEAVRKK